MINSKIKLHILGVLMNKLGNWLMALLYWIDMLCKIGMIG